MALRWEDCKCTNTIKYIDIFEPLGILLYPVELLLRPNYIYYINKRSKKSCGEKVLTKINWWLSITVILSLFLFLSCLTTVEAAESELDKIIETSGYAEAFFYPPHNEYDPNPGIEFKDRIVARYGLEIYTEAKHKDFPVYLFLHPFALFGDSRPQISYNYKANPIVIQIKYGAGYKIVKNLEVRITHSEWKDLGGYKGERLVWNSISLRYKW